MSQSLTECLSNLVISKLTCQKKQTSGGGGSGGGVCVCVCVCACGRACVCVCVCVCKCVCLGPSTVKASSVWISWDAREQINDVVLKTLDSSGGSNYCYFGMQNLTFPLLSCSCTRSGHSRNLTSILLAFRT